MVSLDSVDSNETEILKSRFLAGFSTTSSEDISVFSSQRSLGKEGIEGRGCIRLPKVRSTPIATVLLADEQKRIIIESAEYDIDMGYHRRCITDRKKDPLGGSPRTKDKVVLPFASGIGASGSTEREHVNLDFLQVAHNELSDESTSRTRAKSNCRVAYSENSREPVEREASKVNRDQSERSSHDNGDTCDHDDTDLWLQNRQTVFLRESGVQVERGPSVDSNMLEISNDSSPQVVPIPPRVGQEVLYDALHRNGTSLPVDELPSIADNKMIGISEESRTASPSAECCDVKQILTDVRSTVNSTCVKCTVDCDISVRENESEEIYLQNNELISELLNTGVPKITNNNSCTEIGVTKPTNSSITDIRRNLSKLLIDQITTPCDNTSIVSIGSYCTNLTEQKLKNGKYSEPHFTYASLRGSPPNCPQRICRKSSHIEHDGEVVSIEACDSYTKVSVETEELDNSGKVEQANKPHYTAESHEVMAIYPIDEECQSGEVMAKNILYDTYSYSDGSESLSLEVDANEVDVWTHSASPIRKGITKEPLNLGPSLRRGLFSSPVKLPENLVHSPAVRIDREGTGNDVSHDLLDAEDQLCGDILFSDSNSSHTDDESSYDSCQVNGSIQAREHSSLSTASDISLEYEDTDEVLDLTVRPSDSDSHDGRRSMDINMNMDAMEGFYDGYVHDPPLEGSLDLGQYGEGVQSYMQHDVYLTGYSPICTNAENKDITGNDMFDEYSAEPGVTIDSELIVRTSSSEMAVEDSISRYLDQSSSGHEHNAYSFGQRSMTFRDLVLSGSYNSVKDVIEDALCYYLQTKGERIDPKKLDDVCSFTNEMRQILRMKVVKEMGLVDKK